MDVELLQSMLEVIEESKTHGGTTPAILLEGLEGLPDECISMLASFFKVHLEAVCIATYDPSVKESHSLRDPSWSEVLSRTSVLRVDLPKLVERIEDIPTLITAWFSVRKGMDGIANEISDSFVDALTAYTWPGDIEEFAEALAHATQKTAGGKLTEKDLPVNIRTFVSHVEQSQPDESVDLDAILEDVEKTMIMRALERFPQNKSSAAKMLNISRARLLRRLQQWGIQSESGTAEGDDDLPVFNEVP
jgi:transcriptional regulator of aromatic amino acid metabolism